MPAGSAIIFSALTLHGSGDNHSPAPRRALNVAFAQGRAPEAEDEGQRANNAVPFLEGGKVVPSAEDGEGKGDTAGKTQTPPPQETSVRVVASIASRRS